MALKIGDQAPDFTLPSTTGKNFTLSKDFEGKALILYFYPKDFTPVCTQEACGFRDVFEEFIDLNFEVIGVSKDSVETHLEFKAKHNLPFELLADVQGQVAKKYKATMPILGPKRITYLLDTSHKVRAVVENRFNAKKHLEKMIRSATDYEFQPGRLAK